MELEERGESLICRAIITAALRDLSLETGYLAVNLQGVCDTFCLLELSRLFPSKMCAYNSLMCFAFQRQTQTTLKTSTKVAIVFLHSVIFLNVCV